MEIGLQRLADAEGFCLVTAFHEHQPGFHGAFAELAEELRRAAAHDVVVPSLDHISGHRLLREQMIAYLECAADAYVWAAEP